ncbi:MAG: glycosyltransferase family 4 protein [Thaumarchaeota archaeon]|nr:glycosyltransferase family 4 protein [Nitrososphaerota archaeon]
MKIVENYRNPIDEREILVQIVGNSNRLSLGVKRYVKDLTNSLQKAGVKLSSSKHDGGVVHAVSPVFLPNGKPFVVTVGDIAPLSEGNSEWVNYGSLSARVYRLYFSQIVTRSFKCADAIIALSSQTAQEIYDIFPQHKEKVKMVSPGISGKFTPRERKPHQGIRIGYYREMHPRMQKLIAILTEKKLSFSLHSLTGTSEDNIVDYYNSIDYFIDFMPYRGFGYPLVEARACGTSVILRKDAKIPYEVKRLSLLVEDEQDAADKIASGVLQPYVPVPFKIEKMTSETIRVYEKLLDLR